MVMDVDNDDDDDRPQPPKPPSHAQMAHRRQRHPPPSPSTPGGGATNQQHPPPPQDRRPGRPDHPPQDRRAGRPEQRASSSQPPSSHSQPPRQTQPPQSQPQSQQHSQQSQSQQSQPNKSTPTKQKHQLRPQPPPTRLNEVRICGRHRSKCGYCSGARWEHALPPRRTPRTSSGAMTDAATAGSNGAGAASASAAGGASSSATAAAAAAGAPSSSNTIDDSGDNDNSPPSSPSSSPSPSSPSSADNHHGDGIITPSTSSQSYSLLFTSLSVRDYAALLDLGWRRSGVHLYRPTNFDTCCPCHSIRLDVGRFVRSKKQRRVWNRLHDALPGPGDAGGDYAGAGSKNEKGGKVGHGGALAAKGGKLGGGLGGLGNGGAPTAAMTATVSTAAAATTTAAALAMEGTEEATMEAFRRKKPRKEEEKGRGKGEGDHHRPAPQSQSQSRQSQMRQRQRERQRRRNENSNHKTDDDDRAADRRRFDALAAHVASAASASSSATATATAEETPSSQPPSSPSSSALSKPLADLKSATIDAVLAAAARITATASSSPSSSDEEEGASLERLCSYRVAPYDRQPRRFNTKCQKAKEGGADTTTTTTTMDIVLFTTVCPAIAGRSRGALQKSDLACSVVQTLSRRYQCCDDEAKQSKTTTTTAAAAEDVRIKLVEAHPKSGHVLVTLELSEAYVTSHALLPLDGDGPISDKVGHGNNANEDGVTSGADAAAGDDNGDVDATATVKTNQQQYGSDPIDAFLTRFAEEYRKRHRRRRVDAHQSSLSRTSNNLIPNIDEQLIRSLHVSTVPAYISACQPDVHRLYAKYQTAVHGDPDPFAAAADDDEDDENGHKGVGSNHAATQAKEGEDQLNRERHQQHKMDDDDDESSSSDGPDDGTESLNVEHVYGIMCRNDPAKLKRIRKSYNSFYRFLCESPFPSPPPSTASTAPSTPSSTRASASASASSMRVRVPPEEEDDTNDIGNDNLAGGKANGGDKDNNDDDPYRFDDDGYDVHVPYGTYHQQYRLGSPTGPLLAVGVVDVLPHCLSSVYAFYDPILSDTFELGKFTALREIEYVRRASIHRCSKLKFYYLGYYIHSCRKMRYKAEYGPSQLLCPVHRGRWVDWRVATRAIDRFSPQRHCCEFCRREEDDRGKGKDENRQDVFAASVSTSGGGGGARGPPRRRLSGSTGTDHDGTDEKSVNDRAEASQAMAKAAAGDEEEETTTTTKIAAADDDGITDDIVLDIGGGPNRTVTVGMLNRQGRSMVDPLVREFVGEVGPDVSRRCIVKLC